MASKIAPSQHISVQAKSAAPANSSTGPKVGSALLNREEPLPLPYQAASVEVEIPIPRDLDDDVAMGELMLPLPHAPKTELYIKSEVPKLLDSYRRSTSSGAVMNAMQSAYPPMGIFNTSSSARPVMSHFMPSPPRGPFAAAHPQVQARRPSISASTASTVSPTPSCAASPVSSRASSFEPDVKHEAALPAAQSPYWHATPAATGRVKLLSTEQVVKVERELDERRAAAEHAVDRPRSASPRASKRNETAKPQRGRTLQREVDRMTPVAAVAPYNALESRPSGPIYPTGPRISFWSTWTKRHVRPLAYPADSARHRGFASQT